jgi:putative transposase
MLTLINEYIRESLAIRVERRLRSQDVIETLADTMLARQIPEHIRSDNGPELVARSLRKWLAGFGTKPLYIERAARGRMVIVNHSTASCAMNA